ncbi:magnesium transporter CorA family protein [Gluconobacter wancherniae]|uniref:Magnesium transport protein CorA n=1 Tax=Gluconobacter wancherniae NBRC 103581 TaxID=656744 RepID=A0A511B075_9PROT|nr:magnesium transporter CorA family protein [Gluconobacter wancherniae]MBF0854315.1 magnesium transporter CorA family protein [Gluconobacter wancherniae]GBD57375.1 magnesium transport protein CorA [Gluconobacter wancherniae NBRC 103581]GBR62547.1 magnesium/cobalt transporter CorA [Gluconobacter wancherniae NBRC 103581]GEK93850.1 magnesium transport protein CorA [Gluconobacter wancherniae NBRC 103581]
MFLARLAGVPAREIEPDDDLSGIVWIDLINPSTEEIDRAEKALGIHVPRREELEEIESSSRHYERSNVLYLSSPLVRRVDESAFSYPVGFVLTAQKLVTVRYSDYYAFDVVGRDIAETANDGTLTPDQVMTQLLEEMINRLADILEGLGRTLDDVSRKVFNADRPRKRANAGEMLRETLRRLGRAGDLASMIRDSLLGIDRMLIYVGELPGHVLVDGLKQRLKVAGRDVASLNDFVAQTMNKVQFLLDATLGFINIEQNDGMKVLTVVSSVGIAPTLIAGIYGMNFKIMPELSWHYGYQYSLMMMTLSIVLPLLWFWRRGWFGAR